MIESIVCFSEGLAMHKYVHKRRAECPPILLRTEYRTAIARANQRTPHIAGRSDVLRWSEFYATQTSRDSGSSTV
jgi:hypothetical protein